MKLPRERADSLAKGTESFARSWHTDLSAKLRSSCQVSVIDITMITYDDYIRRLPASSAMVVCSIASSPHRGVMQLSLPASLTWVARMLGGTGTRAIPERPFTPVEQALVTRLVSNALDLMRYSLGPSFPESIAVDSVQYSPQAAKAAGPTDAMVVTTLELTLDGDSSTITFALPADALARSFDEPEGLPASDPVAALTAQIETVPVRISLQFEPTRVRPGVVLSLAEGDLIRMSHSKNRPLNLAVEGQVLAKAAVGASGSQLACVIVDTQEAP